MSERREGRRARVVALLGIVAVVAVLSGCSSDDAARPDRSTSRDTGSSTGRSTSESGDGSSDVPSGAETAAEQRRAEAASHAPSGIEGVPAPNDDDGARNLATVDPAAGPQPQEASGSMASDPMVAPLPTLPDPGRPDVEGLLPLDSCADISAPFYRAVSSLSATSSHQQILDGAADLATVARHAQAPIAAAVQVLLTTAQTAAADAARASDLGAETFQSAVRTVHVYLGDACGR